MDYKQTFSRKRFLKILIYVLFALSIFWIRLPLGLLSDDLQVAPTVETQSLWENFLFHWETNGRILTDVLANLFYRMPLLVWKVFDTGIYVLIARMAEKLLTGGSVIETAAVCILVRLFPTEYLANAGYIASSTNYIYPVFCILIVTDLLRRIRAGENISGIRYFMTVPAVFYAVNHDQSAAVLLGGLLLCGIYYETAGADSRVKKAVWVLFAVTAAAFLFMFLTPGHINRMSDTTEMEIWLPEYKNWTLWDKIYHGFTSTVSVLLFTNVRLYMLFVLLLAITGLSHRNLAAGLFGMIPLIALGLGYILGRDRFICFAPATFGVPELADGMLPLIFSLITVLAVFAGVCFVIKDHDRKWFCLMLLLLGAGSREMMGFSPTVYASSYRTFTFFLFALIGCSILLLEELRKKEKPVWFYAGLGALGLMILL